ncbi:MAG: SDR family NAD(P)-dependent oxidoreductase [Mycobacterium sp.]|uniref:SDR family NAD(P)-dependent oxidoreductase n=1 Tax=Mycobacterium sp. TaxID=1785 RepID=UPI003C68C980
MSRLAGKVAIVTGGAGGIGAATARELAREGAAVAVVDIDEAKATEVADEIRSTSARAIAIGGDLAEEHTARHVVQSTVAEFGRIDVLHNNAALTTSSFLSRDTTVSEMSLDVWQRSLEVNLGSQLLMCKYAVPEVRNDGGGSIVNMSSGAALSGDRTRLAYGVSKSGVHALTMYVATSEGKGGVRANTIVPGLILTDAVRAHLSEDHRSPRPRHFDAVSGTTTRRRRPRRFPGFGAVPLHHRTNDFDRRRNVRTRHAGHRRLDALAGRWCRPAAPGACAALAIATSSARARTRRFPDGGTSRWRPECRRPRGSFDR